MKPKILVAMHYMELGGGETSLVGLFHALDPERVDIDMFVYSHQGELMQYIPKYVNLLPEKEDWAMFERPMAECLRKGHIRMILARLWAKWEMSRYVKKYHPSDRMASHAYTGRAVSKVVSDINPDVEYDLAISYMNPHDFVLDHVRARKKLCWIHTDYSKIDINVELELPVWSGYDHIVSISADCTRTFLQKFPSLAGKIIDMENIMPKVMIEEKVKDGSNCSSEFKVKEGVTTLVSVGRICEAKNYDNIPYMAAELKKLGLKFRWFIIGPGDHSVIDALSRELGVDDDVTFLGPSSNPYPYIEACDIYVHPSRYEGKSIVVREAQILCKPVIITNYPTAHSQINDGMDGVICELDNQKIAEAIYDLAIDREKQQLLIDYLRHHDYTGMDEVEKIYKLIGA